MRPRRASWSSAADELGILLAGPNGQGLVSTPASLCAQIVAPYPPAGRIGLASQSGNLASAFMNMSVLSGVGISRAISAGNAAMASVADYLEWFADDDETAVGLAYVEGIGDGRAFFDRMRAVASEKPVVLVKGGSTSWRAARRGVAHRRARDRRPRLRRRVPPGRRHPRARRSRRRSKPRRRSRRSLCRRGRTPRS